MNTDFADAYLRHWADGEFLTSRQRWANADHLYGLAAECGLKRLMLCFGMPFDATRDQPTNQKDRVHADKAWERYESYLNGPQVANPAAYALPGVNPFVDWTAGQRYAAQVHFDETRVQPHRQGALLLQELLQQAQNEGLL
jgi:hypothetical protein